jgi:hypothetical protein
MATMKQIQGGLAILTKYGDGDCAAEHDVFYAGPNIGVDRVTAEDKAQLEALGWHWSNEFDCWAKFT